MKTLFTFLVITLALTCAALAGPPINDDCPVCGKAGRLIYRSPGKQGTVIFDSGDCKDKFDKAPDKYKVTPKK